MEWIGTAAVLLLIACAAALAVRSTIRKAKCGGGCCGAHGCMPKKVKVADRNRRHYAYSVRLRIEGMTCASCARRVENALNSLDGVWATVDLRGAQVRLKQEPNRQQLRDVIAAAGYTLLDMETG